MKDAASITTGMRLEAKRLGIKPSELGSGNLRDAAAIDRAIGRAVKAERERCVGIILESDTPGTPGKYERRYMLEAIVEKIQAKRPSRRK